MNIDLSQQQVKEAYILASISIEKWKNIKGYYNNRLKSHFIGKIGEIAAASWLEKSGIKPARHYLDLTKERLCDISVKNPKGDDFRIDVKTWSSRHWKELGRCIATNQYDALKQKCNIVLWCIVQEPIPIIEIQTYHRCIVEIAGWSSIKDISNASQRWTGKGSMRKVHNYQLDETKLRNINDILSLIKGSL